VVKKNSEQQSNSEFGHDTISVARVKCRGLLKLDPDFERIKPALKPEEAAAATITLSRNGLKKVFCPFLMRALADQKTFEVCTADNSIKGVHPDCPHATKGIYSVVDAQEYSQTLKRQKKKKAEEERRSQKYQQELERAEKLSKPTLTNKELEEAKKICLTPISHFALNTRVLNTLRNNNITELWQLIVLDKYDLRKLKGVGRGTIWLIDNTLGYEGYSLGIKLNPELEAELQKAK
jgi:hypothetical protein